MFKPPPHPRSALFGRYHQSTRTINIKNNRRRKWVRCLHVKPFYPRDLRTPSVRPDPSSRRYASSRVTDCGLSIIVVGQAVRGSRRLMTFKLSLYLVGHIPETRTSMCGSSVFSRPRRVGRVHCRILTLKTVLMKDEHMEGFTRRTHHDLDRSSGRS